MATVAAIFLLFTFGTAQEPSRRSGDSSQSLSVTGKKAKRGPRAIAIVEFLPNGRMRLVPVALWLDGHYYDASLYGANPEPMAVEPQTVYEAQSFGEPTGTFTVTMPKQVNGNWVADGTWQPQLAMDKELKLKAAKDAAQRAKNPPNEVVMTGDTDSGRPVLKRAPGSAGDAKSSGQPAPSSGTGTSSSSSDSDRPVMKRPPGESSSKPTMGPGDDSSADASTATAKPQTRVDDHDPDRPVFKRPAASAPVSASSSGGTSSASATQAAAADDSDPNRPVLSRGKPANPQEQSTTDFPESKAGATSAAAGKGLRAYPAISDAGQYETRSLLYTMTSGERQGFEQQTLKLALNEIRPFAAKRNGPPVPKNATITDYDVRAYDLEYSSSPTVVLSAKLPVPGVKSRTTGDFTYYVTIVARIDINDQAQKIFSMVSDSRHLDAFPRMELIDAIDADANGRGDLLFREYSDSGISYGLYRVSPYQMEKIFEGGSSL